MVVSWAFLSLSFLSDIKMLPSQKTSFPMLMSLLLSELLLSLTVWLGISTEASSELTAWLWAWPGWFQHLNQLSLPTQGGPAYYILPGAKLSCPPAKINFKLMDHSLEVYLNGISCLTRLHQFSLKLSIVYRCFPLTQHGLKHFVEHRVSYWYQILFEYYSWVYWIKCSSKLFCDKNIPVYNVYK